MLTRLGLRAVGPAPTLALELGERLNLLVGDNGLGKTFLLDVAWWALTRTWAAEPAWPQRNDRAFEPRIEADIAGRKGTAHFDARFDVSRQGWIPSTGRPVMPGVVVYARVDGGFSVWDPARNYWRGEDPERPMAYSFSKEEVWEGLRDESGRVQSKGLIQDWVEWQTADDPAFAQLTRVLQHLSSPDAAEGLNAGPPMALSVDDVRDVPTLEMPYGTVPIVHASAGVRRIAALAYLLVWAWRQHERAAEIREQPPETRLVLLVDEIEAHLHPKWQRAILSALLDVSTALETDEELEVQLLVATHSPLVLASVEPVFDVERDRLFHLELESASAAIHEVPWSKRGDAVGWLTSELFGLQQARSRDAERAIEAAEAWMRDDLDAVPDDLRSVDALHGELQRVLAGHDPFWPRWLVTSGVDA
ncbi:MAG: AAA family ATPase [Acidobacteriota bacterium]